MATRKKAAKPAKVKVRIGGVYKDGEDKKVEIVGRVRGDGKYDFLGIVRNALGPRRDISQLYSKNGEAEDTYQPNTFGLVREIA